MTALKEWASQTVFLTSILTGFSLTIALQLIAMGDRRRVTGLALTAFLLATALLLTATAMGSAILMRYESWQSMTLAQSALARLSQLHSLIKALLLLGLLLFLAGLGVAGWMRSKLMGLISALAAILAALLIFWAIRILP